MRRDEFLRPPGDAPGTGFGTQHGEQVVRCGLALDAAGLGAMGVVATAVR
ncbi:MAG: hypothetical protein ACKOJF_29065 [Planctomycetaceae bacterium]